MVYWPCDACQSCSMPYFYSYFLQDFVQGRPIHILEMILASVRPDTSGKHRFSITMNNQKSYV